MRVSTCLVSTRSVEDDMCIALEVASPYLGAILAQGGD